MSTVFVLDSSVTLTWLFQDESTRQSQQLLEQLESQSALVPALWMLEIVNVMALAERKGRIAAAESDEFIDELSKLNIDVESDKTDQVFTDILPLTREHRLTSYDAVYLDLAIRRQLPLATLDESLRKAAKKVGVKVLGK
jgi:predicted nucleic acid-binding protein